MKILKILSQSNTDSIDLGSLALFLCVHVNVTTEPLGEGFAVS